MPVLDGVTSVVIGLVLGVASIILAYETKSLLIGEAAAPEIAADIRQLISNTSGITSVVDVLTMHLGPNDILAAIQVDFNDSLQANTVETMTADLRLKIQTAHPDVQRLFIEARSGV